MGAFFRKLFRYTGVPLVWTILIIFLLCLPGSSIPDDGIGDVIPHIDKVVHFILFGTFVFLWGGYYSLKPEKKAIWPRLVLIVTVLSCILGIALEYVQLYCIPDRSFDGYDIVADSAGAFAAALFLLYVFPKK